jgi:collagen type III alpha
MASVMTKPTSAAKVEARLTKELASASSRIRFSDLLNGTLSLFVIILGYTLLAVLFDRLFELPAFIRFFGFTAFLAVAGFVVWWQIVRPLRSQVNPRFAARQVEATIPDAKNAVINWVDLEDAQVSENIRAAVGNRAAQEVAAADVSKVGESRRFLWLICSVGLLCATLAVLFFVVKSAPFFSLLKRAYNPFTSAIIATRTEIVLEEPLAGDATVTSGDSLNVRVNLRGSLPDPKGPQATRMLVRYNLDSPEVEEFHLENAGSSREWAWKVPPSIVQNGFRYRITAGDATTPEYTVTVRTRPTLRDFRVKYEYPAYTRLKPEESTDPRLEGYRGTQVTLSATGNRAIKDARLILDSQAVQIPGKPEGDSIAFALTLEESSNYRIAFTTADGETAESLIYPVRVLVDQKPLVTITSPKDEEVALPANGLLAVDGIAADDFGLTSVTLKMRIAGTTPKMLESKKYRGGKSLKREADGSYPMALEVKDSVKLSELKTASGQAVELPVGTVLEYWLEAVDNCNQPTGNVGASKIQRVKIAPLPPPEKQGEQKQKNDKRQEDEKQHGEKQDQQLQNEKRDPTQPREDQAKPEQGKNDGGKPEQKPDNTKPDANSPPKNDGQKPNDPNQKPDPMTGNKGTDTPQPNETKPDNTKPMNPPDMGNNANTKPEQNSTQKPNKDEQKLQDEAKKVQDALDEKNREGGESRPADNSAKQPEQRPAEKKPGGEKEPSEDKPQPMEPQGEPEAKPDAGKPQATPKTENGKPQPKNEQGNEKPSPEQKPGEASESNAGGENKPERALKPAEPKAGKPNGNSTTKPDESSEPKPQPGDMGQEKPMPGKNPQAGQEKPANGTQKPDPKEMQDAIKDLKSGDPKKEQAARDKLDKMMGKENREAAEKEAEQLEKDLKSEDPAKREAAKKEIEDFAKKAQENAKNQKPEGQQSEGKPGEEGQKPDPKEMQDAIKDLKSGDPKKEQAARDKLDKMMGKENREAAEKEAEQIEKDLKSDDPAKQAAAKKKLEDFAKKAQEQAKGQNGKSGEDGQKPEGQKPSKEEIEKAQEQLKDLTSKDDAKRQAAEKAIDEKIGKEAREEMQKDLKDLNSGDPKKAQDAKERLEKRAKESQGKSDGMKPPRGPGDRDEEPGEKLKDDPKNRLKTAELQLKQFEKAKADQELQKKLGYTPEQYEKFVKGYEDMVNRLRDDVAKTDPTKPTTPGGPTTIKVGEGSGRALDKRPDATASGTGAGPGTAPPGYSEAQRKFAEEAAKLKKPEAKK